MNGHILVVEDDCVSATLIENQLRKLGYSIAGVVNTGEEAIQRAASSRPDLVLMDIGLEGKMDGVEAATIIRNRFRIPVIYLTTRSDENTVDRASGTESYGYLLKPPNPPELHCALQMALPRAEMEARVREERKWFVTTVRCILDGVIAADATGAVKLMNPTAARLTGWTEEDALDRDLLDVFCVRDLETHAPVDCGVRRVIHGEDGILSHKLLVARDGTEAIVEECAATIRNESGIMIGVVLVFRPLNAGQVPTCPTLT